MKRTIEQQIVELTFEQKNNLKEIYKKFAISVAIVWVIAFLVGAGLFVSFTVKAEEARDRKESIQAQIDLNKMSFNFNFDLYDELYEAEDEYYDMQGKKPLAFFALGGVLLIGFGIVLVTFKSKYPYFSEKKYSYLKKTGFFSNFQN